MNQTEEIYSFGNPMALYAEYVRRTEPYTMDYDHYHDYYELYYMLSGQRLYFIRDRTYSVEQGDIVFINKHELHKTMHVGEAAHERIILHFSDSFLDSLTSTHADLLRSPFQQSAHIVRLPLKESLGAEQTVRRLMTEITQQLPGFELALSHAASELLLAGARHLRQHGPAQLQHATPMHAKISEIIRHINSHFDEPLRLEQLSEQFYISPYYLSRRFKETTGFTYSDYLILTRIKEAQRLLRETAHSISDISVAVGFDNFSHFGKTFKKITQASPREYRKQHQTV